MSQYVKVSDALLLKALAAADSPAGRQRVVAHLQSRPFPHYEAAPASPGLLVRIEANGKRIVGRFVNRQFQPVSAPVSAKPLAAKNRTKAAVVASPRRTSPVSGQSGRRKSQDQINP